MENILLTHWKLFYNLFFMTREEEIITEMRRYHEATGLAYSTIGMKAHRDSTLYERLCAAGSCTNKTYEKVLGWLKDNMPAERSGLTKLPTQT